METKQEEFFDLTAYVEKRVLERYAKEHNCKIEDLTIPGISYRATGLPPKEQLRKEIAEHLGYKPEDIEFIDPENLLSDETRTGEES